RGGDRHRCALDVVLRYSRGRVLQRLAYRRGLLGEVGDGVALLRRGLGGLRFGRGLPLRLDLLAQSAESVALVAEAARVPEPCLCLVEEPQADERRRSGLG